MLVGSGVRGPLAIILQGTLQRLLVEVLSQNRCEQRVAESHRPVQTHSITLWGSAGERTARCHAGGRAGPFCLPPFLSLRFKQFLEHVRHSVWVRNYPTRSSGSLIKVRGKHLKQLQGILKCKNPGLPLLTHIPRNLVRISRNSLKVGRHVCWVTRRQSVCWAKTHLRLCEVTSHSRLLC